MAKVESTLSLGGSGSTPNLQQVTDEGNTTTNDIILDGTFKKVKSTDGNKYFEVTHVASRIVAIGGDVGDEKVSIMQVQGDGSALIDGAISVSIRGEAVLVTGKDPLTFEGVQYNQDYSSNFTDRSLVDKGYMDGELIHKADLVGGVVPESQLPSYVDDVIEAANFAALPVTGESGKIYITIDNNKTYRWSGSTYVEISSPQIPAVLGLIKIVDKAGDFFTNLATASAYIRTFTSATITDESYSNGTFWFTVPNGSSFALSTLFLGKSAQNTTAYIEDTLGLITTFGSLTCYKNNGDNILLNSNFGATSFQYAGGNNTFRDCTFSVNLFTSSNGTNIFRNCTFGNSAFESYSGVARFQNILLSSPSNIFAPTSSGRFEIYGTIGTTTGNDYANFFPTNTAVIWAKKVMQTNNAGGIEGDLARAQTNGAKLFFGYADGGATDLSYTASPTNGTVVSSTGTDATIPLADGTNAGLILLDSFGDVIVDEDVLAPPTIGTITQPTLITPTGSVDLSGLPTIAWQIIPNPNTAGLTGLTGSIATTTVDNLEESTTYTFQVLSNGDLSVPSADVVIDAQPIPAEYYVRPSGTTYGTGDGTSFANAWSGFTAINWSVLNTKTLNVVGTHNQELNVQQNAVTIVGNNVNGAGIIDAQNTRVCFRINGYNNITVNNLSMINGQTSNAHNMLTTGTIYNNCTFDTSGNQTTQHEGNIISDLISVTYNGCTFKNGTDDGVSLHGDNTTVVLNNCSMENNSQGVNAINTGVCIINDSNFLNNTTDVQPDSSSDITVNRSTFRSQLSANSSVALKLNNCTMLSGETVVTSLGSIIVSDTKYLGLSKITTNQVNIAKVKITRCYFEVSTIAKVTTINNAVYDLSYSVFKHISGTNVFGASTAGTGTSIVNNCTFVGSATTGRGISAQGRVNVKNTIFQGLNLVVNPNGANGIVTFDKCCTFSNTTLNVNQNGGTFTNTNSITTNPLITDIVNLNFALQSGSSCWNTGATLTDSVGILSANWSATPPTVTTKTQPATWDIGAYIH